MKKSDIIISLVVGEITAWYFIYLFGDIFKALYILPVVFPILSAIGIFIAFLIGKKFLFVFQLAKFLLVGALATIVDLGILGFLIWISGISSGIFYSGFKAISFIIATISKYLGDKIWAFEKKERAGVGKEFVNFFLVTLGGLIINVGVASLVVNLISPQFGLSAKIWANIGGIIAAITTFAWNFIGYKFIVFKK